MELPGAEHMPIGTPKREQIGASQCSVSAATLHYIHFEVSSHGTVYAVLHCAAPNHRPLTVWMCQQTSGAGP